MIGVIVVDFNSEPLTRQCLESLFALGRGDLRYYVVDNGGRLDAEALASDFSGVTVLAPGTNLGFAGGYNVGIARVIADGAAYGLLMNPDATASHDFVLPLLAAMESDERIGMACPTQLDTQGQIAFGGSTMNWWSGRPRMIPGRRLRGRGAGVDVPFVSGAAALLRLSAVAEVGPMEESYFLYFEDTDYTQAFRRAGWRTVYVPESEVMHSGSGVIRFRSETYVYYMARNRIRFMRRWGRWYHRFVFTIFNTVVRLPAMLAMYGIARLQPALAAAQLRGYIDGMLGVEGIR